jgi:hypothetical protein
MMDKNKVADLAKSLSTSCKRVVKSSQLAQKFSSPAVTLIAITVFNLLLVGVDANKKPGWGT